MIDPVIVLGVSRSGTTLLRVLLGAGPDLAALPETPWITGAYGPSSLRALVEAMVGHPTGPVENLGGITEEHVLAGARAFARTILDAYAAARGKAQVLLKTPKDIPHVAFLAQLFPRARWIHLVRDGRDVALSTIARDDLRDLGPHGALTLDNALRRWSEWEAHVRAHVGRGTLSLAARITYEALVTEPEDTLREVCAALGVAFDPAMLRYDLRGVDLPSWEAGSRSVQAHDGISTTHVGRFRRELSPAELDRIARDHGDALERFGYPRR